ncbi:MAG TPA: hypothetical protein VGV60_05170 [Candidatus Polarisedimenticolia bacterium]|jgi:tetratricopeptide (TPR) repeat protein|nr:hypothetical protein [Candidatus Polarisedimenticolia bacterium]
MTDKGLLLIPALLGALTPAATGAPSHGAHGAATGGPPPAVAAPPATTVPLLGNLGSHHHVIATGSDKAQQYFDQGLRLVFGFNHDEAEHAFLEAARLDPDCAMAFWGVALALGPNINLSLDPERNARAYDAIQTARTLSAQASEPEAAYIRALGARYSLDPAADRAVLDRAYAKAMGELSRRYPDDLDAATLYAESLMDLRPWKHWNKDGTPAEETEEIVSVLESVLKRDPLHPGANHYYIHAVEASPHPERAIPSAKRLERLVPGAGHLVHMPAHVYMRTGDYAGAVKSNRVAAEVDEAYIRSRHITGMYPVMYYAHNLHFLAMAAGMEGNSAAARDGAVRLAAFLKDAVADMPMAEFMLPAPLYVALRFQGWNDVLRQPAPDRLFATTAALRHFARGVAHAALKDVKQAEADRREFDEARGRVPSDALFNLNTSAGVLEVAAAVLDARIASAKGDHAAALSAWRKGVAAEERLNYDEPPVWYYPVRESLGAELLRAGKPQEAEKVFREDLAKNPRNGRSLFGLWKSLAAQKKRQEAKTARRDFEAAWKNADVELELSDL